MKQLTMSVLVTLSLVGTAHAIKPAAKDSVRTRILGTQAEAYNNYLVTVQAVRDGSKKATDEAVKKERDAFIKASQNLVNEIVQFVNIDATSAKELLKVFPESIDGIAFVKAVEKAVEEKDNTSVTEQDKRIAKQLRLMAERLKLENTGNKKEDNLYNGAVAKLFSLGGGISQLGPKAEALLNKVTENLLTMSAKDAVTKAAKEIMGKDETSIAKFLQDLINCKA